MKKRILWVDILNIVACLGVLLMHTSNHQVHSWNGEYNMDFWWGLLTHTLDYWPVPIFLMLSGNNILSKNCPPQFGWRYFYRKRFLKTMLPFLLWSLIYSIPFFLSGNMTLGTSLEYFVQTKYNSHMWFFIPLFAFYLSVPFLSAWLRNVQKNEVCVFLLIVFLTLYVVKPVFRFFDWGFFEYSIIPMGGSLLFYPIMGYAITRYSFFQNNKKTVIFVGAIAAIVHFSLLYYSVTILGNSKRFQNVEECTCALIAVAVYVLFISINWDKIIDRLHIRIEWITVLSSCSLGVYLIQKLLFIVSNRFDVGMTNPYYGAFVTYFIAILIVLAMKKVKLLRILVP